MGIRVLLNFSFIDSDTQVESAFEAGPGIAVPFISLDTEVVPVLSGEGAWDLDIGDGDDLDTGASAGIDAVNFFGAADFHVQFFFGKQIDDSRSRERRFDSDEEAPAGVEPCLFDAYGQLQSLPAEIFAFVSCFAFFGDFEEFAEFFEGEGEVIVEVGGELGELSFAAEESEESGSAGEFGEGGEWMNTGQKGQRCDTSESRVEGMEAEDDFEVVAVSGAKCSASIKNPRCETAALCTEVVIH